MEPRSALLLAATLGLLQPARMLGVGAGQPPPPPLLRVEPPEPEVALAVGESLQFTCSLECPRGEVADVHWRGLDTSLGAVQSHAGSSTLTVQHASPAAAGMRVCVGSCGDQAFQRTVTLLVYAFPDQLTVHPTTFVPELDRQVACTAHNITHPGPDVLSFSLLLGDQELEGAEVLDRDVDEQDLLFHVTERWLLPPLGTPAPPALRCLATMTLPGLELSRSRDIPVLQDLTSTKTPDQTSLKPPNPTSPKPPDSTSPKPPDPTSPKPPDSTSPKPPDPTSPKPPDPTSPRPLDPTSPKPPDPTSPKPLDPTSAKLPDPISPEPPNPKSTPMQHSSGTCRPKIRQAPPSQAEWQASLELLCEASCGQGWTVYWTLAPGGLAAYERREAGSQAWLRAPQTRDRPAGWFQCQVDPGGQLARLYVPGQDDSSGPGVAQPPLALWTNGLVLGLLLLAAIACHLRRRCRHRTLC